MIVKNTRAGPTKLHNLGKETKYTSINLGILSATKRSPLLAKMEAMAPLFKTFYVGACDNHLKQTIYGKEMKK